MKTIAQLMYDEFSGIPIEDALMKQTLDFLYRNEEIDDAEVLEQSYMEFIDNLNLLDVEFELNNVEFNLNEGRKEDCLTWLWSYRMGFVYNIKRLENRTENNQTEKKILERLEKAIMECRKDAIQRFHKYFLKQTDDLDVDRVKEGLIPYSDWDCDVENRQMLYDINDELVEGINEGNITSIEEMVNKWIEIIDEKAEEIADNIRLFELWNFSAPSCLISYEDYC